MKKLISALLSVGAFFALIFVARQMMGGIAVVALGFLGFAVLIVFVAVFSKAYRNWPS
ncbi:MAG: hypothetical protein KF831_16305 [Acidobacteria bacterium]|nr:hypothetical protein [Acidobacteriota bacterium]